MDLKYVLFKGGFKGPNTSVARKMYFPDRSMKEARVGLAEVKFVKEKETYGFIVGNMVPAEEISQDNLAAYCSENGFPNDITRPQYNYQYAPLLWLTYGDHEVVLAQVEGKITEVVKAENDYTEAFMNVKDFDRWGSYNQDALMHIAVKMATPLTEEDIFECQVRFRRKDESWRLLSNVLIAETKYNVRDTLFFKGKDGAIISLPVRTAHGFGEKTLKTTYGEVVKFRKEYGLAVGMYESELSRDVVTKDFWLGSTFYSLQFYRASNYRQGMEKDEEFLKKVKPYVEAYQALLKKYQPLMSQRTVAKIGRAHV